MSHPKSKLQLGLLLQGYLGVKMKYSSFRGKITFKTEKWLRPTLNQTKGHVHSALGQGSPNLKWNWFAFAV